MGEWLKKFLGDSASGLLSGLFGWIQSKKLTGAEREQNQFNADEASKSRQFNSAEALAARNFSSAEAERQRQFEANLSNTSYQRAVADMQKAGINPAMAMSQGGASTPSGAMAASSVASSSPASGSGRGVPMSMSDIMSAIQMQKQNKILDAEAEELQSRARKNSAEAAGTEIDNLYRDQLNSANLFIAGSRIDNINSDTASRLIENYYKPDLLAQQLKHGEFDFDLMAAQIAKIYQEIENLEADEKLTYQNILNQPVLRALYGAEQTLNEMRTHESEASKEKISAEAFRYRMENNIEQKYGRRPGTSVTTQFMDLVLKASGDLRSMIDAYTDNDRADYFGSGKSK